MAEKLIPLDLPPGLKNNGTVQQSKDRWFAGDKVRFYQGNKQPIGGWVQRTLTGATITGTPNAAHSWSLNDGTSYLAMGTTTGLWLVDSSNVVYDIMAVGLVGGTPYTWQLENMGSRLMAVYNLTTYSGTNSLNALVWPPLSQTSFDPSVPAVQAFHTNEGPNTCFGVVVTPERYLIIIRSSPPNGAAKRSPDGSIIDPADPDGPVIVQ